VSEEPDPTGPRRGVWLFPNRPAGELVEAVIRAEELGLDEVWIADEGIAREPMGLLAAAARETTTITLATGITSPLLRHPGAVAAAAATVDELSRGRFRLGLGIGGDKSLGPFGLATDRPVGVLREAVETARAVFEVRPADGYEPADHAFGPRSVPIWIGARGPQMIRMAAGVADGIFLSGCSPEQHTEIVTTVRSINAAVGTALYQSASDLRADPTVVPWDEVAAVLDNEAERLRPTSIGINLVDVVGGQVDAVSAVERAAAALALIGDGAR
jgi:alkanesulfonate monooxygenase SsuD/methylene tetrahydromethanopterin reductase-like flavin-dependent oxidoreductase (luciferase family)